MEWGGKDWKGICVKGNGHSAQKWVEPSGPFTLLGSQYYLALSCLLSRKQQEGW